jgi:membrane-associated protein
MREIIGKLWYIIWNLGKDQTWRDMLVFTGGPVGLYAILFAIIFAETGLVVTPFLPGDSLIFAVGAVGARDIGISLPLATGLLIAAAILGNLVNYAIGRKLGPAVFKREDSWLLNKKHLLRAHEFYEKYGAKTIILSRFVPIVRTFAPFVAGIAKMDFLTFFIYNAIGGTAWVLICVMAGYWFGQWPWVKAHFEIVAVAIVVISVLPVVVEFLREYLRGRGAKARGLGVVEEKIEP